MNAESKPKRIERFAQACRARGLPVTTQRRTVLEMILDREDHPTAEQVYEQVRVRIPSLSRTSVYRILDTLVRFGIINKICHPGSATRFDPKIRQHHHLICMHCEKVLDIEEQQLDKITWPDVRGCGFTIRDYHIHFRGLCADCADKLKKGGGAASPKAGRLKKKAARKSKRTSKKRRAKP